MKIKTMLGIQQQVVNNYSDAGLNILGDPDSIPLNGRFDIPNKGVMNYVQLPLSSGNPIEFEIDSADASVYTFSNLSVTDKPSVTISVIAGPPTKFRIEDPDRATNPSQVFYEITGDATHNVSGEVVQFEPLKIWVTDRNSIQSFTQTHNRVGDHDLGISFNSLDEPMLVSMNAIGNSAYLVNISDYGFKNNVIVKDQIENSYLIELEPSGSTSDSPNIMPDFFEVDSEGKPVVYSQFAAGYNPNIEDWSVTAVSPLPQIAELASYKTDNFLVAANCSDDPAGRDLTLSHSDMGSGIYKIVVNADDRVTEYNPDEISTIGVTLPITTVKSRLDEVFIKFKSRFRPAKDMGHTRNFKILTVRNGASEELEWELKNPTANASTTTGDIILNVTALPSACDALMVEIDYANPVIVTDIDTLPVEVTLPSTSTPDTYAIRVTGAYQSYKTGAVTKNITVAAAPAATRKVIGYAPTWGHGAEIGTSTSKFQLLDETKVSKVLYAFVYPDLANVPNPSGGTFAMPTIADGEQALRLGFNFGPAITMKNVKDDIAAMKAKGIDTFFSVGGATYTAGLPAVEAEGELILSGTPYVGSESSFPLISKYIEIINYFDVALDVDWEDLTVNGLDATYASRIYAFTKALRTACDNATTSRQLGIAAFSTAFDQTTYSKTIPGTPTSTMASTGSQDVGFFGGNAGQCRVASNFSWDYGSGTQTYNDFLSMLDVIMLMSYDQQDLVSTVDGTWAGTGDKYSPITAYKDTLELLVHYGQDSTTELHIGVEPPPEGAAYGKLMVNNADCTEEESITRADQYGNNYSSPYSIEYFATYWDRENSARKETDSLMVWSLWKTPNDPANNANGVAYATIDNVLNEGVTWLNE